MTKNVTCLACGCLCDDIGILVDGGRIVEALDACPVGREWFVAEPSSNHEPEFTIEGEPTDRESALDRAVEILVAAQSPLIWGLTGSTIEAIRPALAIADLLGAVVDLAGSPASAAKLEAFQRMGQVSASLGEVKDRADLVVFWGVDPLTTHPRHWERYSVEPRGRFIPGGRADRFVIVVDAEPTPSSQAADLFVPIDRSRQAEALDVVRSLVHGISLDPDRAARSAGIPFLVLQELADKLGSARYGALFFEPGLNEPNPSSRTMESLLKLVRELNEGRRFVALEMGTPGNASGAAAVLAWQAGAAAGVDYGLGYPRHLPREAVLESRLVAGQVDAVLMVSDDHAQESTEKILGLLAKVPTILLSSKFWESNSPSVSFRVGRPGIESGGTVCRIDGVLLPLRPSIESQLSTDRQILEFLHNRLEQQFSTVGRAVQ